jgi:hypothetical protein
MEQLIVNIYARCRKHNCRLCIILNAISMLFLSPYRPTKNDHFNLNKILRPGVGVFCGQNENPPPN